MGSDGEWRWVITWKHAHRKRLDEGDNGPKIYKKGQILDWLIIFADVIGRQDVEITIQEVQVENLCLFMMISNGSKEHQKSPKSNTQKLRGFGFESQKG